MKIPFRQGIVSAETDVSHTPIFVSLNVDNFVDLNASTAPVMMSFAYKYHGNYLVELRKDLPNAWGPFTDSAQTAYLYWDISFTAAALTYGATLLAPVYQSSAPVNPSVDQHWFNTATNIMMVWDGMAWLEHIRLFAATVHAAHSITPMNFGSQAGLVGDISSGFILYDEANLPIRTSDGYFFTTETDASAHFSPSVASVKLDQNVLVLEATESMVAYSLVSIAGPNLIKLANVSDPTGIAIGLVTSTLLSGESAEVVFRGVITLPNWSQVLATGASSFPNLIIGHALYLGTNGQLTWDRPQDLMAQRVGTVINTTSIYLSFDSETLPFPPLGGAFVPTAGGTMTGPLILSGDPSTSLGAATEHYVNTVVAAATINLDGGGF